MTLLAFTPQADPSTADRLFEVGDRRMAIGLVPFSTGYPTGGEPLTAAYFGLDTQLDTVVPQPDAAGSRLPMYDSANKKLKLFTAVGTEAAAASNQTGISIPVVAVGK